MGANTTPSGRAIVIAGPTASGKSALALAIAERLGGIVINADSMQVYRDLRILTARPTDEDTARVPHRLYGHVDAAEAYSVGRWLGDVGPALREAQTAGRVPVIVGGTGLYIKALTQGLSDIPPIPADIRMRVRARAEAVGSEQLHRQLADCDPLMAARLRPSDPQRILRALEVFEATGRSLLVFQANRGKASLAPTDVIGLFLAPPRSALKDLVGLRFDAMMEAGALDEVAQLGTRGLPSDLPAMRALGVAPLLASLRGELGLAQAIEFAKLQTNRYVKRQLTFARHQLGEFPWIAPDQALDYAVSRARQPA